MFNRRRRSYRKGPPANQIYVPHDQRNLNQDPIPITTERQAQYYYKQLHDMGYIPDITPPTPVFTMPDVIVIKAHQNGYCLFSIDSATLQMVNQNMDESPNNYDIQDVKGNVLSIDSNTKRAILEQDGYTLFPFMITSNLGFHNDYSAAASFMYYDADSNQRGSSEVGSGDNFNFPSLNTAFCTRNYTDLMLMPHEENRPYSSNDLYSAISSFFRIKAGSVTCFIYQNQ